MRAHAIKLVFMRICEMHFWWNQQNALELGNPFKRSMPNPQSTGPIKGNAIKQNLKRRLVFFFCGIHQL